MILPDVSVLLGAFRSDAAHHETCRTWLTNVLVGEARFGISPLALSALVRVSTNPRAFQTPSSLENAFAFCDYLRAQSHCQVVEPGDRHWDIFSRLCLGTNTRSRRVTDAWYAALAIEWGCEWITLDRDFARFPGLKWRPPEEA